MYIGKSANIAKHKYMCTSIFRYFPPHLFIKKFSDFVFFSSKFYFAFAYVAFIKLNAANLTQRPLFYVSSDWRLKCCQYFCNSFRFFFFCSVCFKFCSTRKKDTKILLPLLFVQFLCYSVH